MAYHVVRDRRSLWLHSRMSEVIILVTNVTLVVIICVRKVFNGIVLPWGLHGDPCDRVKPSQGLPSASKPTVRTNVRLNPLPLLPKLKWRCMGNTPIELGVPLLSINSTQIKEILNARKCRCPKSWSFLFWLNLTCAILEMSMGSLAGMVVPCQTGPALG